MLGPSTSLHSRLHQYDSSSSEDEEERLNREEEEEEEQERLLSMQHGEANEAASRKSSNNKRSRQQTDAEIANALNSKSSSTDGVDESGKKRMKRVVLDETKLTGSRGLIAIRREFPIRLRYKDPKQELLKMRKSRSLSDSERRALKQKQFDMEVNASANYISSLMDAYQTFAMDIAPNMHYTDTFNRIQDLGSRKMVREYMDNMREEICREHMNKIYGVERTDKLMRELEYGLNATKERLDEDNDTVIAKGRVTDPKSSDMRAPRKLGVLVSNDSTVIQPSNKSTDGSGIQENDAINKASNVPGESDENSDKMSKNSGDDDDNAPGTNFQGGYVNASGDVNKPTGEDDEEAEAIFDDIHTPISKQNSDDINEKTEKDQEEDDEEAEAIFDDVSLSATPKDGADANDKPEDFQLDKNEDDEDGEEAVATFDKFSTLAAKVDTPSDIEDANEKKRDEGVDDENDMERTIEESDKYEGKNEESMIEEFSQFEETDIQEKPMSESSQKFMETQTIMPSMTQASMLLSKSQDHLTFDASQNFVETQTIVPSMTQGTFLNADGLEQLDIDSSQALEETQTIVPTMTPTSQRGQRELDYLLTSQEY